MQDDRAGQAQKATTTDDKMRHMIDLSVAVHAYVGGDALEESVDV